MNKRHVLFVINSLGIGGAEKSLTSLLNTMDYEKYDVDLLMFHPGGSFIKLIPEQVHVLPQLDFLRSNKSIARAIVQPKYLVARILASIGLRINRLKCNLHPAQSYWKYAGWAFNKITKVYDIAIAWGQGNPTHYVAERVHARKKIAFVNADYKANGHNQSFDKPFYIQYNSIVCVSEKLTENMLMVFPDMANKILTIYDINNAKIIEKMASEYNPYKYEDSELILATVGRLVPLKGFDLAIAAAEILMKKKIDFKWFIIGDGPLRSELQNSIQSTGLKNKVILVGAKDNPYGYMKNCNIYVQTSRFEGYCLTLAEARILNKPVISTNFEVVHNQIRDGVNGLIVDMTGSAIAEGIIRLYRDKTLMSCIIDCLAKEKKGNIEEIEKLYAIM